MTSAAAPSSGGSADALVAGALHPRRRDLAQPTDQFGELIVPHWVRAVDLHLIGAARPS